MADIRHSIQITAPPEAGYRLAASAEGFRQWWAADVAETGGAVELAFFNRTRRYRLRPAAEEPSRQAEWICETGQEWSNTRILFRLEPAGPECCSKWGELMFRLKGAAEGKSPGPLFLSNALAY